jgi:SAM-dependent methyltransferase
MEHVPEPSQFLGEIYRVLKPGGVVIMTTPFLVPLHEEPHDYYRYTRHAIQYLLTKSGFKNIEIEPFGEYFAVSIAFGVQIQLKFWNGVSKKLGIKGIYSEWNPFVFLFVVLPQYMYLALFGKSLWIQFAAGLAILRGDTVILQSNDPGSTFCMVA